MEDFELIDEYLDGNLTPEERTQVEHRRATDPTFAEEFAWQLAIRQTVSEQAEIENMAQSLVQRLKAEGYFEQPPIVPPTKKPFFRRRPFWWILGGVTLVILWAVFRLRSTDKAYEQPTPTDSKKIISPPPSEPIASNGQDTSKNGPSTPSASTERTAKMQKALQDMAQRFIDQSTEKTDNTANDSPSVQQPTDPALLALQSGDTTTALRICRAADQTNPDQRNFGAFDRYAHEQLRNKRYSVAYDLFENFLRWEGDDLPEDERAQTYYRMFLCCATDWPNLRAEGRNILLKINKSKLPPEWRANLESLKNALKE